MSEKQEKKHVVGYRLHGDGMTPAATPFGAVLRVPLPIGPTHSMHPGRRFVSLGVSFDVPVYLVPIGGIGIEGPQPRVVLPGEVIGIEVADNAHIDAKATVAHVLFFANPDRLEQV